jgi:hypothetical protein
MGSYRRTLRKSKARRSTRRSQMRSINKQRGGAYETEALRNFLQNATNYQRSVEIYNTMVEPCIMNFYPRFVYRIRAGQNGEPVPIIQFLVLISSRQSNEAAEQLVPRDLIYIVITAEDNTFVDATVDIIPKYLLNDTHLQIQNRPAVPAFLSLFIENALGAAEGESATHNILAEGDDLAERTDANERILEALAQLYRQPDAEHGVGSCPPHA